MSWRCRSAAGSCSRTAKVRVITTNAKRSHAGSTCASSWMTRSGGMSTNPPTSTRHAKKRRPEPPLLLTLLRRTTGGEPEPCVPRPCAWPEPCALQEPSAQQPSSLPEPSWQQPSSSQEPCAAGCLLLCRTLLGSSLLLRGSLALSRSLARSCLLLCRTLLSCGLLRAGAFFAAAFFARRRLLGRGLFSSRVPSSWHGHEMRPFQLGMCERSTKTRRAQQCSTFSRGKASICDARARRTRTQRATQCARCARRT